MQAVRHGRISTVEALVQNGANINATDFEGNTAFDHAKSQSRRKMTERLLKALRSGARSVNARSVNMTV